MNYASMVMEINKERASILAMRSNAHIYSLLMVGIADSNPAEIIAFVSCVCYNGSSLCNGLITRSEESYGVCVCVCVSHINLKTSLPRPGLNCSTTGKASIYFVYCDVVLLIMFRYYLACERWSNPITCLDRPWGFQEVEAPRFQDNRHIKVISLSALGTGRLYPRKYSCPHFY
jgi:hypothetical protein